MSELWKAIMENLEFLAVCLLVVLAIFAVATVSEHWIRKKNQLQKDTSPARKVAVVGMFSAISAVLMLFELPLWFAPGFYELDFSEIPVMICAFSMGPVAGVMTELCKVLLKLVMKGTSTAFVGDFANFVVGCSLVLPASIIYYNKKTKKRAVSGLIVGTLVMTVFGSAFNALYLLPKFSQLFEMPMDAIIGMGTAVNGAINSVWTLVLFAVVPFNLLKGAIVSVVTLLLYKHISPILKGSHH
ncbi:MAG: ECF transporter S component [Lachnospiraceae bacterium]|nr:ECF transporter S component [Lachnospiraceae bacterium]